MYILIVALMVGFFLFELYRIKRNRELGMQNRVWIDGKDVVRQYEFEQAQREREQQTANLETKNAEKSCFHMELQQTKDWIDRDSPQDWNNLVDPLSWQKPST